MLLLLLLAASVESTILFLEEFNYTWPLRWKQSQAHMLEGKAGKVSWARPEKYYNAEQSKGLKTMEDNKFYHYSCDIGQTISTFNKTILIGYTATQTQDQRCAGSYFKFYKDPFDQDHFDSDTPYEFMFGHEYCGSSSDQVHCVFNHNGIKHEKTQKIWTKNDKDTHWFGIKLYANHTFEAYVDLKREAWGTIGSKWKNMKQVYKYNDDVPKPDDWDDREEIEDPDETKPEDWDDINRYIPDPNATKPVWWNETTDGNWTAPIIFNPNFKGEFHPKIIKNPNYTGPWESPLERNYQVTDTEWRGYCPEFRYIAIDDWQVEAGTIFDNIIITDDPVEYDAFQRATYFRQKNVESPGFVEDWYEREISRAEKDKEKKQKKIEDERERIRKTGVGWEIPEDDEQDEWYMEDI